MGINHFIGPDDVPVAVTPAIGMPVTPPVVPASDWAKVRSTNSTDGSFPAKIPTVTEPTGAGVIAWAGRTGLLLIPYGTGADDSTFDVKIIGWAKIGTLWVPALVAQVAVTLSTIVGVAAAEIVATERFADTLALTKGLGTIVNPVGDTQPASLMIASQLAAFEKLEFVFDLGTATAANAIYMPH